MHFLQYAYFNKVKTVDATKIYWRDKNNVIKTVQSNDVEFDITKKITTLTVTPVPVETSSYYCVYDDSIAATSEATIFIIG